MQTREIWDRLGKVAMQDGQLTEDENKILMEVLNDVDTYRIRIERVSRDGKVDDDEQDMLDLMRQKILTKMKKISEADGNVTKEESALIKETLAIMSELEADSPYEPQTD